MIGPTCYFLGMHLTNVKFQKRIEDHLSGRIARPDFIFYVNALIQFTLTLLADTFRLLSLRDQFANWSWQSQKEIGFLLVFRVRSDFKKRL